MATEDKKPQTVQTPKAVIRADTAVLEATISDLRDTNAKLVADAQATTSFIAALIATHAAEIAAIKASSTAVVGKIVVSDDTCPNGHVGGRTIETRKGVITRHCGKCGLKWKTSPK